MEAISRARTTAPPQIGGRVWPFSLPAVAAPTAAAATAATAATGTSGPRPRFVDGDVAATEILAVEGLDGGPALGLVGHLDETKPARSTGVTVGDDVGPGHLAVRSKESLQLTLTGLEGEIPHVDIQHDTTPKPEKLRTERDPRVRSSSDRRRWCAAQKYPPDGLQKYGDIIPNAVGILKKPTGALPAPQPPPLAPAPGGSTAAANRPGAQAQLPHRPA